MFLKDWLMIFESFFFSVVLVVCLVDLFLLYVCLVFFSSFVFFVGVDLVVFCFLNNNFNGFKNKMFG